uniref:RING-type domain-containing protein n=1 Tax=Macrostomum lignano TaxID=282301 RepID=A0A1I8HWN3_9PLAT
MLEDSFNDFVDTSGSSSDGSRSEQHTTGCSSPTSSEQQSNYEPQPQAHEQQQQRHNQHHQRHHQTVGHFNIASAQAEQRNNFSAPVEDNSASQNQQDEAAEDDAEFADFESAPAAHFAEPAVGAAELDTLQSGVSVSVVNDDDMRQASGGSQNQFAVFRPQQPISIEEAMAQALSSLPSRLQPRTGGGSVGGDTGSVRSLELSKPADAVSDTASTGVPSTAGGAGVADSSADSAPNEDDGGRDRYEVLKQLERPDEGGFDKLLAGCLDAALDRIQEGSNLFSESEDCQEQLSERRQRLRLAWANFIGFFTTPSGLLPSESELADSIRLRPDTSNGDDAENGTRPECRCCICLNYLASSSAILYAGRMYHCPCANFWINEIDSARSCYKTSRQVWGHVIIALIIGVLDGICLLLLQSANMPTPSPPLLSGARAAALGGHSNVQLIVARVRVQVALQRVGEAVGAADGVVDVQAAVGALADWLASDKTHPWHGLQLPRPATVRLLFRVSKAPLPQVAVGPVGDAIAAADPPGLGLPCRRCRPRQPHQRQRLHALWPLATGPHRPGGGGSDRGLHDANPTDATVRAPAARTLADAPQRLVALAPVGWPDSPPARQAGAPAQVAVGFVTSSVPHTGLNTGGQSAGHLQADRLLPGSTRHSMYSCGHQVWQWTPNGHCPSLSLLIFNRE